MRVVAVAAIVFIITGCKASYTGDPVLAKNTVVTIQYAHTQINDPVEYAEALVVEAEAVERYLGTDTTSEFAQKLQATHQGNALVSEWLKCEGLAERVCQTAASGQMIEGDPELYELTKDIDDQQAFLDAVNPLLEQRIAELERLSQ